jgi:hypothetical protein
MAAKYLAADTLGMQLFGNAAGKLWGAERQSFTLGPWNLDVWTEAHSDFNTLKECGVWVRVTDKLWLYCWVGLKRTLILVVDAKALGISQATREQFSLGTGLKTIAAIRPHVVAVFELIDPEAGVWARISNDMLGLEK